MNVILDACVLYPAPLRDFLLNLADLSLFVPKWSEKIQEEWITNLLKNRTDLHQSQLQRTKEFMDQAFPEANVKRFENVIETLNLPDQNDRHVLAAAIKSKSEFIVTYNLKDFPFVRLNPFKISSIHPDDFVCKLLDNNELKVSIAFSNQLNSLQNPPISKEELLETLKMLGLMRSTERMNSSEN